MRQNNSIYFRVILVTVLLIIANQIFIQYWLYQKRSDSETINVAGKQRMISQRLVNIYNASESSASERTSNAAKNLHKVWEDAHIDLIQRHGPHIFSFASNNEIYNDLNALSPVIAKSKSFITIPSSQFTEAHLEAFRLHQDEFLANMNAIVFKIERLSQWKLNVVVWIELLFALFSLFMVYYEINFVFRKISSNLNDKNKALEESNEMLEQYAYLAAHDLRSPTQNILNFSGLLHQLLDEKMDEDEKSYFQYILDSAERMQDTTENLLNFSSINNEKLSLTTFNPSSIIDSAVEDLAPQIQSKNAEIVIEELPDSIIADKNLLHLVFQNLIANGIKFVQNDTRPVLHISYGNELDVHAFHFKDNGIGIHKDQQAKIFGIFKRLHTQEDFKGTGIGLSICKKVIEKHNGTISLQSARGAGSIFTIRIPKKISVS